MFTSKKDFNNLKGQLGNLKGEFNAYKEKISENDDQIDRLENFVKFLSDKAGYKLYKLKNENESLYSFNVYSTFNNWNNTSPVKSKWEEEPLYQSITLEELQTLGEYTTFTVGKDTYLLAQEKKERRGRKNSKKLSALEVKEKRRIYSKAYYRAKKSK